MTSSLGSRSPSQPRPEESAATLLSGVGAARLDVNVGGRVASSSVLHGLTACGDVVLVLAGHDVAAMDLDPDTIHDADLHVVSSAPVPDLHLPRAGLRASGHLCLLPADRARQLLAATTCTGPDLGEAAEEWYGSVVALLTPEWTTLHAHGRCAAVGRVGADLVDPLAAHEVDLVHRLDAQWGGQFRTLVRAFAPSSDPTSEPVTLTGVTRVRVVGIDRLGLTLLALRTPKEAPVSLRLPFGMAVATPEQAQHRVAAAVARMRTCLSGGCSRCVADRPADPPR